MKCSYAQYRYEEFPHFLVAQTKGLFVKVQLPGGQRVHFPLKALSLLLLPKKKLSVKMLAVTFDDNENDNHVVLKDKDDVADV